MRRFSAHSVIAVMLVAASTMTAEAALYSGAITSVNADAGSISVDVTDGRTRTFRVPDSARIEVDGTRGEIADLMAGQRVSVFTNAAGAVTRVRARSASPSRSPRPEPRPSPDAATSSPGEPSAAEPDAAADSSETGWTQFRGPGRENKSPATGLMRAWPNGGPPLERTLRGLGVGYSTISLADGRLLTMGGRDDAEYVLCYDVSTGEELWATRIGRLYRNGQGDGPRSTPTIDGDRVYALSARGDLVCLNLVDGTRRWGGNILEEFEGENITWGISESPLVDGGLLICTPGGRRGTMVALDKMSGRTVWTARVPGAPAAAYASPIAVEAHGTRQYVNFTHAGVIGVRADDGRFLWGNDASANGTANCSTALYENAHVFTASGYGTGGALVRITGEQGRAGAQLVYHTREMENHHGGMVLVDGHIYGADGGVMTCLDFMTGDVRWQDRSVGKGAVVYADGMIILRSENGPVALMQAAPEAYRELGRFDQPQRSNRRAWAHPVVAEGRLFLRDQDNLLIYDLRE